jgi:predicted phage-related endonuclease
MRRLDTLETAENKDRLRLVLGGSMTIEIEHKVVDFDDAVGQWLRQYKEAQDEVKKWQEVADIARSNLESAMGEAETAMYQNRPVVRWTYVESKRFDTKRAREILPPQVIEVLETISTSRRFTIVEQD